MKRHVNISIEECVLDACKLERMNISQICEASLRASLLRINPEIYDFHNGWADKLIQHNIELKQMEIEQLRRKMVKVEVPMPEADQELIETEVVFYDSELRRRAKKKLPLEDIFIDGNRFKALNERLSCSLSRETWRAMILDEAKRRIGEVK